MIEKPETLIQARRRMIQAAEDFSRSRQGDDWGGDYEITAFHEAGHAVAAAALGLAFDHVSILPERDDEDDSFISNGRVKRERPFHELLHEYPQCGTIGGVPLALKGCIFLMAGLAAQLRWANHWADLLGSGENDQKQLYLLSMLIAAQLVDPNKANAEEEIHASIAAIQAWAWREACLMTANPYAWNAIHKLARHLEEHETATEAQVLEIVREAKVRWKPQPFRLDRAEVKSEAA